MKTVGIILAVLVGLAVIVVAWYIGTYNTIIVLDEDCNETLGNIETDLQRRMDLIPNLVSTVKGYMAHEKDVLQGVTEARSKAGQLNVDLKNATPAQLQQFMGAQDQLGAALSRLLVTIEKYPDLKANQSVTQLMDELAGTENRIGVSSKRYNASAKRLNTNIRGFFGRIVAGKMGIERREPFEAAEGAKTAPVVEF